MQWQNESKDQFDSALQLSGINKEIKGESRGADIDWQCAAIRSTNQHTHQTERSTRIKCKQNCDFTTFLLGGKWRFFFCCVAMQFAEVVPCFLAILLVRSQSNWLHPAAATVAFSKLYVNNWHSDFCEISFKLAARFFYPLSHCS